MEGKIGMDKRSFLAIAVTFAILLGWQTLFVAPRQREANRKQAIIQAKADSLASLDVVYDEMERIEGKEGNDPFGTEAKNREEVEDTAAEESGPFQEWELGRAKKFTVTTENIRVGMTSLGGEITSIQLLGYERMSGGPVELVPEGTGGVLSLSVENDNRWTRLSGTIFKVKVNGREANDGEDIDLTGEMERVEVVFSWKGHEGGAVEKRFVFSRSGYQAGLSVSLLREGALRRSSGYAVSWESGMALNEKDRKWELRQMASLGRVGDEYYKESPGKFGKISRKEHDGMVAWAGARTKYFLSAIIVDKQRSGQLGLLGDKSTNMSGYSITYPFLGDPKRVEDSFTCYFGPLDMKALKEYGLGLERTIDLGKLRFFSVYVLRLILWMNGFIPNYGLIIIILSIMTKVLFYRLTHKSFKSMKDMQRLQPRLKALQEKYKDEKEKLNKETMKMYKEAGVNPLGGCLPLLFQMPVFIALFNVLRNTIELRGAPLGLWISDLSSPDVLFSFGVKLPILGSNFHLLPILMGVAMFAQSKMGGSPTGQTGPASQTKMMTTMMPVVFTFLFYGMPSGLVLYWLINNILSIVQQYYVHKSIESEEQAQENTESA